MGKTNTPFNKIYFPITALDTVENNATTNVFDYLAKPFRFNNLTATQLKIASLPSNVKYYTPSKGGIMKILEIADKSDLDKYFVTDLANPEYASLVEMLSNVTSTARLKIFLIDIEEEVGDGVLPNATDILESVHNDDVTKLAYKKISLFKDQLHTNGYWVQGFTGLGFGETVASDVVAKITPELLSLSLLDKLNSNTPVVPANLLPADKAAILESSIDIDYNKQDNVLFVFEVLEDGESIPLADIEKKAEMDASTILVTYTKGNGAQVTLTIPASPVVDQGGTSSEIRPAAIRVIDFDKTRITNIAFSDTSIPAKYTLSVISSPSSVEYVERFKVKDAFEDTSVHIVATNEATTLLTSATEVVSIKFVENEDLENKFGFLFEEKDIVNATSSQLAYLYVKLGEVKIAKSFGTNINECLTFIEISGKAEISGTLFSYNMTFNNPMYDILKAEAEGSPIVFIRCYDAEQKAGSVIDLTQNYENLSSEAAMGKFFSTSLAGGLDSRLDILAASTNYSDAFIDKTGIPTLDNSTVEDIDLDIPTLSFLTPVKIISGQVVYFWDNPVSLLTTSGVYNTAKELYIKAYSFNSVNSIITSALVNLPSRMYSENVVDAINDALDDVLSDLSGVFGDQVNLSVSKLNFFQGRLDPKITTSIVDGVRVTTFNLTDIATVTIASSLDKFTVSYTRTIQA